MNPIIIDDHAREAMQMRRVSKDEVFDTIRNPETTDYSSKGFKRYFKGQICVVTHQGRYRTVVKTVLYRYGETWTDKDVRMRDLH